MVFKIKKKKISFQAFPPKPGGLETLFQKLDSQESHLIMWARASMEEKKRRGEMKKRNAGTQKFVAKNIITGKTLIVPNFLFFPSHWLCGWVQSVL